MWIYVFITFSYLTLKKNVKVRQRAKIYIPSLLIHTFQKVRLFVMFQLMKWYRDVSWQCLHINTSTFQRDHFSPMNGLDFWKSSDANELNKVHRHFMSLRDFIKKQLKLQRCREYDCSYIVLILSWNVSMHWTIWNPL